MAGFPTIEPAATRDRTESEKRALVASLRRGNCVALVGPNLHAPGLPSTDPKLVTALSHHLAETLERDDGIKVAAPADFPLVAQLFADRRSRSELEVEVTDFYARRYDELKAQQPDDRLFDSLAKLPFSLYVCSRADRTLEHFLTKAGRAPVTMSYNFRGNQQLTVGAAQGAARPLVYYLFGSVSDPASLALTQRDLLDLLQAIVSGNPALPTDLRNQFRDKSLLFIGCGLDHYNLRFLLHVLGLNRSREKSFAVDAANADSMWFYKVEYQKLQLIDVDATEFIEDVARRCADQPSSGNGAPKESLEPKDRPRVFISYAREDQSVTESLRVSLERHDIDSWRDKDQLYSGDGWEHSIDDAIAKADFFVALVSRHFRDGVETYAHVEVARALKARERRGGVKFIYPLQIGEELYRLDALDRAGIQSSPLRDIETDVSRLAMDIRREYAKIQRR
jgi:hypothetical protein